MRQLSSSTSKLDTRFVPDAAFRGRIVATIIERRTGPERNLEFLIDLDGGEISTSPNAQPFSGSLSPGGNLDYRDCARAVEIRAPGDELAAYCMVKDSRYSVGVRNLKSGVQAREWSASKGWRVSGLIWSADSKSIAVLSAKERMDFGLVGLLSAASGHPIPLITFEVTLLCAQTGHELKLPVIREDSPSGWARLDWIQ